jgi:hypothetical protein
VMEQIMVHLCYGVDVFVYGVSKMVHCIVIGHLRKKTGITGMKMISGAEQSFKIRTLCELHTSL